MDRRTCSACGVTKDGAEFFRRNHSQCRVCHSKDANARRKQRGKERRQALIEYMGSKCQHCGHTYPIVCYDLHHLDPANKEFQFNALYERSMPEIYREADKCILLCSNCHRIEHERLRKII